MDSRTFWHHIDTALDLIESTPATTLAQVADILNRHGNPGESLPCDSSVAFFGGSGGDRTLRESLWVAGWRIIAAEASYYYAALHPVSGDTLTYIEGDVYAGNRFDTAAGN